VPLNDIICFHCEQTAEKYLKALLEEQSHTIPQTHNLNQLLTQLLPHDATLRSLRRRLVSLSRFAVDYRYPGQKATARQAQAALRSARHVRQAIRQRLGLKP
jgi:HEPN domain-containing protein